MAYKGAIPTGTKVKIELALGNAKGAASLLASFTPWVPGKPSDDTGTVVNPGLSDAVEISVPEKGLLSIVVDMSEDLTDRGTLHVWVDGAPWTPDPEDIEGDTKWTFSIEAQ